MQSKPQNKNNIQFENYWLWNSSPDPFNTRAKTEWSPYDNSVSRIIEENFNSGVRVFDVQLGPNTYTINLNTYMQYLKNNPTRCRPISRASRLDTSKIIIEKTEIVDTTMKPQNPQVDQEKILEAEKTKNKNSKYIQLKVSELFGEPNSLSEFIRDPTNEIFNTSIILETPIHQCLFTKFYNNVNFKDQDEVISYMKDEFLGEAEKLKKLDLNEKEYKIYEEIYDKNYFNIAKEYIDILQGIKFPNLTFEERIITIYTIEGFLASSLRNALKPPSPELAVATFESNLHLSFLLLQASISVLSKRNDSPNGPNCVKNVDGDYFYFLYRPGKILEKSLQEDIELLKQKKGKGRMLVFKEFLNVSYRREVADVMLVMDHPKIDYAYVLYTFQISKEVAENRPGLFCFLETITSFPIESEVLLSAFTDFQIESIQMNGNKKYYEIKCSFVFDEK